MSEIQLELFPEDTVNVLVTLSFNSNKVFLELDYTRYTIKSEWISFSLIKNTFPDLGRVMDSMIWDGEYKRICKLPEQVWDSLWESSFDMWPSGTTKTKIQPWYYENCKPLRRICYIQISV